MIIIYSTQLTERLQYILDLIFNSVLKVDFELTDDKDQFSQSLLPKINYSDEDFGDGLFLKAHPLLFQNDITKQKIRPFEVDGQFAFFPSSTNSFLPFDIFACSFYLASRYEEYLFTSNEQHKRFPASSSIQYKENVLTEPLINQWAALLANRISRKFPNFIISGKTFRFLMTIDIDNAWAYKNKPIWLQLGAMAKSVVKINFAEIKTRLKVLLLNETDPFDTYQFIIQKFVGIEDRLKFFFLMGNRGKFDKSISYRNPDFQILIRHLSTKFEIGIHPSYASNENNTLIETEKKRLEGILEKPIINSRNHYLMLKMPSSYRNLLNAGITKDFTMGYHDAIGFRAGLCCPFYFFDLHRNKTTNLLVYPLHAMDVSMKDYMKLSPQQAMKQTINLMEKVKAVGGTFVGLWHNESLNNQGAWKNWQDIFTQTIQKGIELENA